MPIYTDITDVMPVSAMVTGAAVSSALCDQIRDNLVALYDGWWFQATRTTTATLPSTAVTPVPMDTIARSRSAVDDGTISLANGGTVTIRKSGIWRFGFHFAFSSPFTGLVDVLLDATDAAGGFVAERLTDANAVTTNVSVAGSVNVVTIPTTITPNVYTVGTPTIGTTRPIKLWGIWRGDSP